jgi:cytochrome c-type biogenesis protein CcmF
VTAEFGLAALWFAAALAFLQLVAGALALTPRGEALAPLVRPTAIVQGALALIAFLALIAVFAQTDLSVRLVALNSHSAKPLLYKIAGTWGNHEGSMLLWVTVMGLAGGFVALVERRLPEPTMLATLAGQAFVSLGFYAFLLFASNPFQRLNPVPAEGQGLNPLLQDPGLAFHPPTLYLGYVGLSIAFSFAIGALVTREVSPAFARAMRPWVLGAWIFLTVGITAGSYWAYYELGWGGWWFWDPVENASLMPPCCIPPGSSPRAMPCARGRSCSAWSPSRCRWSALSSSARASSPAFTPSRSIPSVALLSSPCWRSTSAAR